MYYLYVQRFEIICCFYVQGMMDTEYDFKTKRPKSIRQPQHFTLFAGLLARSQYPRGPATGHLVTDFSWFTFVYKRMLRWFPGLQVATACFSCSPPDLNFLDPYFIFILSEFHIYVHA